MAPVDIWPRHAFQLVFWVAEFWQICEFLALDKNRISGTSNHDRLRRGTRVNPKPYINARLGAARMEILNGAYDSPAVWLLKNAAFPCALMDFLNTTSRPGWGFIRNLHDTCGVKAVADKAIRPIYRLNEYDCSVPANTRRLNSLGPATRKDLARFFQVFPAHFDITDYALDEIARLLAASSRHRRISTPGCSCF